MVRAVAMSVLGIDRSNRSEGIDNEKIDLSVPNDDQAR
jgi:hypothetical protein